MLNEYELQKQKEFDTLYRQELDLIDDKIVEIFANIIKSMADLDDFIKNLFKEKESYRFEVNDRIIHIDCDDDMYIIDISPEILSDCDAFHIYEKGSINYEHHDLNKEVYWNDDINNFDTNEEKLKYFEGKIKFIDWLNTNGSDLVKLMIQAIEYNEEKSPILKDIKELKKLVKSYTED